MQFCILPHERTTILYDGEDNIVTVNYGDLKTLERVGSKLPRNGIPSAYSDSEVKLIYRVLKAATVIKGCSPDKHVLTNEEIDVLKNLWKSQLH